MKGLDTYGMSMLVDIELGLVYPNCNARSYLGYSEDECPLPLFGIVPSEELEESRRVVESVSQGKHIQTHVRSLRCKDGTVMQFHAIAVPGWYEGREALRCKLRPVVEKSPGALFADGFLYAAVIKENMMSEDDPFFQRFFASVDWQVNSKTLAHLLIGAIQRWANETGQDADTIFQDYATEIAMATVNAI